MTAENRIHQAIQIAEQNGWIDGEHHKQWVIDQMLRVLLDDQYPAWREEYEAPDEDGETHEWDEGISP